MINRGVGPGVNADDFVFHRRNDDQIVGTRPVLQHQRLGLDFGVEIVRAEKAEFVGVYIALVENELPVVGGRSVVIAGPLGDADGLNIPNRETR